MTTATNPHIDLEQLFAPNGRTAKIIQYYARKLVKLKVYPKSEQEDVEQELSLRLLRRIRRFEAERSSIATFVDRAVRFEALEIIRTRCKPTHVRERKMRSLDAIVVKVDEIFVPFSEEITREDQVRGYGRTIQDDFEQVDLRQDVAQTIQALPEDLRETCRQVMAERNPSLAIMRLPAETRERLRVHFEAAGLLDYLCDHD